MTTVSKVAGLIASAAEAYDGEDRDWFTRQPTDALAALWGVACASGAVWDDEVYDELARRGWFDPDAQTVNLGDFTARVADDSVKIDLELTCDMCDEHLCDVEGGDTLASLVGVAHDHAATCPGPIDNDTEGE